MPDLLLELRSEEIPARMQRKAAGDLRKLVTDGLVEAGLTYEAAREYWTPRRLALDIRGLTARSRDVREERKGPSTRAPDAAIQGFLRGAGLAEISQAHVHSDPKKGEFYVAHIVRPGRAAEDIVAELLPRIVRAFPWPKEMRWGASSGPKGVRYDGGTGLGGDTLRWVRPLQSIVCTFGPETEEPVVIDFEVGGVRSGNTTYGHRFHSPGAITVRRFDDYAAKLRAGKVIVDADQRKEMILSDARNLAFANGLDLVEDDGLLEEVSGLIEWPVVLMGEFDADFLDIPAEVIRLTIRANQKCFVTRVSGDAPSSGPSGHLLPAGEKVQAATVATSSPRRGEGGEATAEPGEGASKLSSRFILTANIEAKDGGREIAHGNGKVVRARLSDALYFWKTDQADLPDLGQLDTSAKKFGLKRDAAGKLLPLDQRMARLDHLGVTFHAKLGTQGERVQRIARLAEELAPIVARAFNAPSSGSSGHLLPAGEKRQAATSATSSPQRGEGGEATAEPGEGVMPPAGTTAEPKGEITQLARRAAVLAKADLTTEIVGEFPELQGAMGRKYALLQGEQPSVAAAIEEHYKPQGPSDRVPTDPVSIAVALADKLDTLVGFWAIDEKPTGSKDPYALRRAALGVVRILVENEVRLHLFDAFLVSAVELEIQQDIAREDQQDAKLRELRDVGLGSAARKMLAAAEQERDRDETRLESALAMFEHDRQGTDLLSFFHDRLKVYLRDKGARHDLIDAVLAGGGSAQDFSPLEGEMAATQPEGVGEGSAGGKGTSSTADATPPRSALPIDPPLEGEGGIAPTAASGNNDDLLAIVRRVEALGTFLDTGDGRNLLAGAKRAANILAAEEKKGTAVAASVDPVLFRADAERSLFSAVNQAESDAAQAIQNEDYSAAMRALSQLRAPVDSFFEDVHVNDEDATIRANRLALLARIRAATGAVADFSRIAG